MYLAGRSIYSFLGGRNRVHSRHKTFDNLEIVMDHLGERCQAISGAGGVGDYFVAWVIGVQVHADDEHWCVSRRGGDNNFLGTTFHMSLQKPRQDIRTLIKKSMKYILNSLDFTYRCLFDGREYTGRFDDIFGASLRPWNRFRFTLAEDGNFISIDNKAAILGLDFSLESTMGGVILEHVDHVIETDEGIIDGNDLSIKISY